MKLVPFFKVVRMFPLIPFQKPLGSTDSRSVDCFLNSDQPGSPVQSFKGRTQFPASVGSKRSNTWLFTIRWRPYLFLELDTYISDGEVPDVSSSFTGVVFDLYLSLASLLALTSL